MRVNFSNLTLGLIFFSLSACSTTKMVYQPKDYQEKIKNIKRIKIMAKSSEQSSQLASLVAHISTDLIKEEKNFLIDGLKILRGDWGKKCSILDGVLIFTPGKIEISEEQASLEIKAELYKCSSNELVWEGIGWDNYQITTKKSAKIEDHLKVYYERFPEAAQKFAVPVYQIVKDLFKVMPDYPSKAESRKRQ